ncbi:hypothetical protein [Streptomyces sp. YU58]|uniref:hypothetical protein n=1 Tax=Streptomyces sp. SX92 TaxID=3158972 RepID=UPI0027B987E9|nr:hypothetical protein [Streptomyces coralus]WLW54723.1 hypothetical protein QU709_26780 [Streptomyces coralus]
MRLPKPACLHPRPCLRLAAAPALALALALAPTPSQAHSGPSSGRSSGPSSCAASGERGFPLTTRVHGGPNIYEAGGGYGTWYLDLTNKTTRTCGNIHPVIVLVDGERALGPAQPRLEFYDGNGDGDGDRPHPVRFEETDADELVGVLADERGGFPGFTVGPGRTLTVKMRLAVTSDAVANEVTANAAVVQRQDDDGEWVGQSNDYRFTIEADPAPSSASEPDPNAPDGLPFADELASTGVGPTSAALTTAALLLVTGATLLLIRSRRRP